MFISLFAACFAAVVIGYMTGGPGRAGRVALVIACLMPTWLMKNVAALSIDLRLVVVAIAVPLMLLDLRWIKTLNLVDLLVATLLLTAVVSMHYSDSLTPSEFVLLGTTWLAPYVFGRLLVASMNDMDRLIPYLCAACLVLSAWSAFESTTRINPINALVGRIGSRSAETDIRMGLRRAEGPTEHPIFFGMAMAMLAPWTLEAARRAGRKQLPRYYRLMPFICMAGVFFTVSRGPMLVFFAAVWFAAFYSVKYWRIPLVVGAASIALFAVTAWPVVVEQLQEISGEETSRTIVIGNDVHQYSGTKHRTLLYLVYDQAVQDAGWLGFGKWGEQPEHMVLVEPQLRQLFGSIDNHYLVLILNWGRIGLGVFVAMGLLACGTGMFTGLVTRSQYAPYGVLIGAISGTLLAVMVMLLTVWFSGAIGFAWLVQLGILTSCLTIYSRRPRPSVVVPTDARDEAFHDAMVLPQGSKSQQLVSA